MIIHVVVLYSDRKFMLRFLHHCINLQLLIAFLKKSIITDMPNMSNMSNMSNMHTFAKLGKLRNRAKIGQELSKTLYTNLLQKLRFKFGN